MKSKVTQPKYTVKINNIETHHKMTINTIKMFSIQYFAIIGF